MCTPVIFRDFLNCIFLSVSFVFASGFMCFIIQMHTSKKNGYHYNSNKKTNQ